MRWPPRSRAGTVGVYVIAMALFAGVASSAYLVVHPSLSLPRHAIFDLAPLSNFFDLTVVNDTAGSVWIDTCADRRCRNRMGLHDTLRPGDAREEAAWLNDQAGVASVAVFTRSGERCLRVAYRAGQERGRVDASTANTC